MWSHDTRPPPTTGSPQPKGYFNSLLVLKPGVEDDIAKYRDQFRRRVRGGRCFATPYLGCREFAASFGEADGTERPIERSEELGPMLLDIAYDPNGGRGTPRFFQATLDGGVLRVPDRFAEVS